LPPPERGPIETPIEVAALLMTDDSHIVPAPSAIPQPSAMTAQEPAPPTATPESPAPPALAAPARPDVPMMAAREPVRPPRQEPQAEWPAGHRMPPGVGMAAVPHGSNFESASSSARYLTAEQKLSVDRLRAARNEIFVRKDFKDDALRITAGTAELEAGARVAVTDPHSQYLTTAQLQRLSPDQLVLVRSEILARRGRYFKDPALRAYFEQFAWYRPYAWEVPLTPVERANVDLIRSHQQTMLAPGPAARWRAPPM
jgi:hypothetical protein